jgi:hypothetical protein
MTHRPPPASLVCVCVTEINITTVALQTRPGEVLACTLSHGRPGQTERWHAFCCRVRQARWSIGICSVTGLTRPGGMLACFLLQVGQGQAEHWHASSQGGPQGHGQCYFDPVEIM